MREGGAAAGRVIVAVVAVLLAAAFAPAQAISNARVQDLLTQAKLGTSRVGVSVVDVETGRTLVSIRAGEGFIPASNMKLLTSGAALAVLGPDFEFRTTLWRRGDRLIIEGAGDPAFADPEILDEMAEEARALGADASPAAVRDVESFISWIAGHVAAQWSAEATGRTGAGGRIAEVIVDDRVLDREYVHPRWPADQLGRWYCAEVSGLNFFANVVRVFVAPTGAGEFSVRAEPRADWLPIERRLRAARKGEGTALDLSRTSANNTFLLRGSVKTALVKPIEATTHEASLIFARLLAERLGALGLSGSAVPSWRLADPSDDLGGDRRALVTVRTPLAKVLQRCNGDSHNLYAEALIKRIGHEMTGQPGSWANGAAVIRMQLRERIGPEAAAAVTVSDGSGMSRDNIVTPAVMTSWLAALSRDSRIAPAFIASVPLAKEEGNMVKRFRGRKLLNDVRCKSGYINGVRTLSGYVIHPGTGRLVAFSILVNEVPANVPGSRVKEFHEDVVVEIDQWLAAQTRTAAETRGR